ncbi:MAG: response regulator, partial [Selenomonadaceae bacterium]|nr:response regulator [Selenomonadaceae bacterium]
PFDVFIIDWKLRDLDGIEVARQIRNIVGNGVPILLMTAYDWPIIRDEAVAAGVNGFCNKPLFMSELYNSLEKVLKFNSLNYNKVNEVEKPTETAISFAGKRLLLVDDIEVNREIATMMLQMNQFEVDQAANGEEAVTKIKNSEPGYYDVVLMDIQMPIMNGYEATKSIRDLNNPELANIPIIAMTANAFDEDRKAALDAGMNGHIAKPIDIEKLLETLNNILK